MVVAVHQAAESAHSVSEPWDVKPWPDRESVSLTT